MSKICILHDYFVVKWWWERLTLIMRDILDCDIAMNFCDRESFYDEISELEKKWKVRFFGKVGKKGIMRHLKLKLDLFLKTKFLKNYETVIFSWDATSGVWNVAKNVKKIYYIHTIPRHLFDQKEKYLKKVKWFIKPAYICMVYVFRFLYLAELKRMNVIIANSSHVALRISEITWRDDIKVLYPCVDLDKFKPEKNIEKTYYLSFAKLATIKRVGVIIEAFKQITDKKLVVIYWNNDPQKDEFLALWKWFSNIEFIRLRDNNDLTGYINWAIATIFIPENEDFGMVAIESMACGVPVIGINDWWVKETIIDSFTWILIPKEGRVNDLIETINKFDLQTSLSMKSNCTERASEFSLENFTDKLKQIVYSK